MVTISPRTPVFVPVSWALPNPGTNGYITSWGAMLAGFPPPIGV